MEIKDDFKSQYLKEIKIYHAYIINIFTFYCYHLHLTNLLKYFPNNSGYCLLLNIRLSHQKKIS